MYLSLSLNDIFGKQLCIYVYKWMPTKSLFFLFLIFYYLDIHIIN